MRVIEGQKTKEEKVRTVKAAVCKTMAKTVAGVKLKKKKKIRTATTSSQRNEAAVNLHLLSQ